MLPARTDRSKYISSGLSIARAHGLSDVGLVWSFMGLNTSHSTRSYSRFVKPSVRLRLFTECFYWDDKSNESSFIVSLLERMHYKCPRLLRALILCSWVNFVSAIQGNVWPFH